MCINRIFILLTFICFISCNPKYLSNRYARGNKEKRNTVIDYLNQKYKIDNFNKPILIDGFNIQNSEYIIQVIIDSDEYYLFNFKNAVNYTVNTSKIFSDEFVDDLINKRIYKINEIFKRQEANLDSNKYFVYYLSSDFNKILYKFEFEDFQYAINGNPN